MIDKYIQAFSNLRTDTNRNTIEFLGIWERLNNPDFKPVEFDGFKKQAGLNSFTLTQLNSGSNNGTCAHKESAFERQLKDEARLNVASLKTSKR